MVIKDAVAGKVKIQVRLNENLMVVLWPQFSLKEKVSQSLT